MEQLYQIACDISVDLQTRYDAVRIMQHMRKTDPVDYARVQGERLKKKMRKLKQYRVR